MDNNTRKYPRTLEDAFKGPEYANPIRGYRTRAYTWRFIMTLYVVSAVALAVIWWTS